MASTKKPSTELDPEARAAERRRKAAEYRKNRLEELDNCSDDEIASRIDTNNEEFKQSVKRYEKEFEELDARRVADEAAKKKAEEEAKLAEIKAAEQAKDLEEQEMARRVLARRSLLAFIMRFEPHYEAGWVHKLVCAKLEQFLLDCRAKKAPRLMLFMPPRAGKSLIASQYFPPWALGHHPSMEFISTSYSSQLSNDFSRKARDLLMEPKFHSVFRTRLDTNAKGVEHWHTTRGGGYVSAGVGGGITGKGADCFIIDDPIRNQEDADSFTNREMQKGWYQSTAYSRLAPGGGMLIIQTRWHMDDLSGWLEELSDQDKGDKFEIVRFPAIAIEDEKYRRKGEALHPARYDASAYKAIERVAGPRKWAALYQQNPVPDDGVYFKGSSFHYYENLPPKATLRFYASWDLAIGLKEGNDFTAGVIWAVDPDENIFIVTYHHGRFDTTTIIDHIIDSAVDNDVEVVTIEKGQIQMAIGPVLNKTIADRKAYSFAVEPVSPGRKDKITRGRSIQARMMQGRVFFPKNFEGSHLHKEMMQFPSSKHDDFVDAVAYIGLYLDSAAPGTAVKVKKKKSWRDDLSKYIKANSGKRSSMAS